MSVKVTLKVAVTKAEDILKLIILARLSCSDKVSFCDHILSVVHLSIRKQFLQRTSPPKPLIGF